MEAKTGHYFRALVQPNYPAVLGMSAAAVRQTLVAFSLQPALPPVYARTCHACGSAMKLTKWADRGSVLVCSDKACPVRFKADPAYTPRYDTTVTEEQWLRASYCFSMQSRIDQAVWYAGVNETKVGMLYSAHRDITAW